MRSEEQLKDTLKNMSLDYNKALQILKEVEELCVIIKTKKGIFKVFAIADTAMDIVKILEKKNPLPNTITV